MRPITKITILGMRLGVVVLLFYWVAIFVGTHLPSVADFSPQVNDKTKHVMAFFVLGSLLCYVTTSNRLALRFGMIVLAGMVYAGIDEITQGLVPGRHPDWMDFVADSCGLIAAVALYATARALFRRPPTSTTT